MRSFIARSCIGKEVRMLSWDSLIFRGRAKKDSANKRKKSEMEERDQESMIAQKPRRRECSTESDATKSLNYAEK